ncbi:hypothetical protein SAMN05444336_10288 [Albimonas donghaensis]|uniref:Holin of 3TMs, for gene-transfer release n=1 Tax=Albimonas donghaensis TaxID=356660 RepID=A0A1H2VJ57_9RHOB|nr:hypothetical protein [Albimonas donghaensis]SDW68371.1 hypothetical protein SAMN05444336_10288 [Albimonas donghaensis]
MVLPILGALGAAVVPALASRGLDLLTGVFSGAADAGVEKVAKLIEDQTGIRIEDVAEQKLTDAQWIQLKEFELRNQELLLAAAQAQDQAEIERMRVENEDRKNARGLQRQALRTEDWFSRNFIYVYALLITVMTGAFIGWAAFGPVFGTDPDGSLTEAGLAQSRIVDTVLGFLLGVTLSAIIQFFFGSSQGSSRKGAAIERLLEENTALKGSGSGGK